MTKQPVCEECPPNNSPTFANLDMKDLAWANPYKNCIGGTVGLEAKSQRGSSVRYQWLDPDGNELADTRNMQITGLEQNQSGHYTFVVEGINEDLTLRYTLPFLSVAPSTMYWSGREDGNWNNIGNWASDLNGTGLKAIPASCTSVHIPYLAVPGAHYPSLSYEVTPQTEAQGSSGIYGIPEADSIVFHYGSELAYAHKLSYRYAKVQYDFGYYTGSPASGSQPDGSKDGSPTLSMSMRRDRWYPLAAPLKHMASGDFAFGGYPYTWQSSHDVVSGNTVSFDHKSMGNDTDLGQTHHSIIVKTNPYRSGETGSDDHKHLQNLKGVLEMPYFENTQEAADHPGHRYDPVVGLSTFYYFNANTLQTMHAPVGRMQRGEESYRFVFEGKTALVPINRENALCYVMDINDTGSKHVLVGNPLLASIDMQRFYEANSNVLEQSEGYRLYVDEGGPQWKKYEYMMTDGSRNAVNSFQAFIVSFTTAGAGRKLCFPLEGSYALTGTETNATPRRAAQPGALSLSLRNSSGLEGDYAELAPVSNDDTAQETSKLLSTEAPQTPEVFFIADDNSTYRLMQAYRSGEREVCLGVRYSDHGDELNLTFNGMDEFLRQTSMTPVLVDRFTGSKQVLSEDRVYRFTQSPVEAGTSYIDSERFSLRFLAEGESLSSLEEASVDYHDGRLTVYALSEIKKLAVYDTAGRLVLTSSPEDESAATYSETLHLPASVYTALVTLKGDKVVSRKFIVR